MSSIHDVLWPGMEKLHPAGRLGGILARKRGYHNSRDHLPSYDYSVAQFAVDREGPDTEAAAIDWTFPDAQAGDYRSIAKFSSRLLAAGRAGDPRTIFIREFFGNTDSDREVEGWDFSKNRASSSDTSHLWHIHISIHRKYVNSVKAMQAILSILSGESLAAWNEKNARKVDYVSVTANWPVLRKGDDEASVPGDTNYIKRAQALLVYLGGYPADAIDGDYGPMMASAVVKMMKSDPKRSSSNGSVFGEAEWRRATGAW
jgi:hypothetical protein